MTSTLNFSWLTNLYRQRAVQWFTVLYLVAIGAIFIVGANGMQLAGDTPLGNICFSGVWATAMSS